MNCATCFGSAVIRAGLLAAAAALILQFGGCPPTESPTENPPAETDPNLTPTENADQGVALNDPLSMPKEPTLSVESFNSAEVCAGCHPNHYNQWKTSMHSYATQDPIWRVLVSLRQADFEGERDQFCTQCHSAIATRGGEVYPGFSFDGFSQVSLEGVTCEACHKVASLQRRYNSGHVLDEDGPERGPIADPAPSAFHESEYSELHNTADFCGGCHDVIEQHGLNLERPFEEFGPSVAAAEGRNCQTCHMPEYSGKAAPPIADAPERDVLHSHRFIGVDVPLADGFVEDPNLLEEVRAEVVALLKTAAEIEVDAAESVAAGEQLDLFVTVRNLIDAHSLPTGSTFNRQLWIAVTATDADDNILYQTGHLDDNGDLRNYWSSLDQFGDDDLIEFGSRFIDERGNPTVFPWKAAEHIRGSLSPLYVRTFTFFVPTGPDTNGPINIDVRLRFRAFPPFLVRAIGLGDLADRLMITDIDEQSVTVNVGN